MGMSVDTYCQFAFLCPLSLDLLDVALKDRPWRNLGVCIQAHHNCKYSIAAWPVRGPSRQLRLPTEDVRPMQESVRLCEP